MPFVSMGFATFAFPDDFLYARGSAFARNSGVFRVGENAVVDASAAVPVRGSRITGCWHDRLTRVIRFPGSWHDRLTRVIRSFLFRN